MNEDRRPLPHDLDAEADCIARAITDRSLESISDLLPEHCYSEPNEWILRALRSLCEKGHPWNIGDILVWLRQAKKADFVGGAVYLDRLASQIPYVVQIAPRVARVRELANVRATIQAAHEIVERGRQIDGNSSDFSSWATSRLSEIGSAPVVREKPDYDSWPSPLQRVDCLTSPLRRLPTGFPTLDRLCRGGIPERWVTVIIGPPGNGKTTDLVQIAVNWLRHGVAVGILAVDEDWAGILYRIGVQHGIALEDLESAKPEALDRLRDVLFRLPAPFMIADPAEDAGATIDNLSAWLVSVRGEQPSALMVDSIQAVVTAVLERTEDPVANPRTLMDRIVGQLKRESRGTNAHCVVATSEAARTYYASKQKQQQTQDLAAGKESSGIEYGVGTQIVLRRKDEYSDEVEVRVPKNRRMSKGSFTVRLRRESAMYIEIDDEHTDGDGDEPLFERSQAAGPRQATRDHKRDQIIAAVRELKLTTPASIYREVKGTKQFVLDLIREMTEHGLIRKDKGVFVVCAEADSVPQVQISPESRMTTVQNVVLGVVQRTPGLNSVAIAKLTSLAPSDVNAGLAMLQASKAIVQRKKRWHPSDVTEGTTA